MLKNIRNCWMCGAAAIALTVMAGGVVAGEPAEKAKDAKSEAPATQPSSAAKSHQEIVVKEAPKKQPRLLIHANAVKGVFAKPKATAGPTHSTAKPAVAPSTGVYAAGRQPTWAQLPLSDRISIDLRETRAELAFRLFANLTGRNTVVSWRALENMGVTKDTPVTLQLENVPVITVLRMIMVQLDEGQGEMMAEVTRSYIRVTTRAVMNRKQVVRIYGIKSLVMHIPKFTDAPQFDLDNVIQEGEGGGAGIFDGDAEDEPEKTEIEMAEEIMDIVRNTVEPDIWQANGGDAGAIRYFQGSLIIRAPVYVHQQIGVPSARTRR